jgi:hypothetical protein
MSTKELDSYTSDVAVAWLKARLTSPQRVADVIAEWCGGKRCMQKNGARRWEGGQHHADEKIVTLNRATRLLRVEVKLGQDDRFWWAMPAAATKEAA